MNKPTYGISSQHLDFISYKVVKNSKIGIIYVFTHERNGKIRKKKVDNIGYITRHHITKQYAFFPKEDWCFSAKNTLIIGSFLNRLEHKFIIFDEKIGEFLRGIN